MSPVSLEEVDARRYGGVNGNDITLTEKRTRATRANNKVIEFKLRNDSLLRPRLNLLFFCFTLLVGNLANSLAIVTLSVVALALHCKHITTSIDFDTLLVVESVGIQISSKKIFAGFNSSQFLPWTTVEDVFVNEVITGSPLLPDFCRQRICQRRRENEVGSVVQRIKTVQGMPGIHVRGVGESYRTGALQEHPTLNVPGSYWLSHKQNIYKFTFKYQEATRNTREFRYKDELMKVIRRIIKCQPSQGEISTLHLLITYKHTFWTRQDKMFAMLKFHNGQGATVFPHAFILTISIPANIKYQIDNSIIKNDQDLSCTVKDAVRQSSTFPPIIPETQTINEYVSTCNETNKNCVRIMPRSNSKDDPSDSKIMPNNTVVCDKLLNDNVTAGDSSTCWRFNGSRKRRRDTWTTTNGKNLGQCIDYSPPCETSTNFISNKGRETSLLMFPIAKSSTEFYNPLNNQASPEIDRNNRLRMRRMRLSSEQISPRSSNITDQVMEGLMFTIKQDKDNVKVVEQRTKMEFDEVLENSEKVETKEGEKCLVNSSLLKLENLVTKIEISDKRSEDQKQTDAAPEFDNVTALSQYSILNEDSFSPTDTLEMHRTPEKLKNVAAVCPNPFLLRETLNRDQMDLSDERIPNDTLHCSSYEGTDTRLKSNEDNQSDEFNYKAEDDDNDNDDNNNKSTDSISDTEVQINMWKLLQDITRGARVMIERISDVDIKNATGNSMVSAAKNTRRRVLTRSKK